MGVGGGCPTANEFGGNHSACAGITRPSLSGGRTELVHEQVGLRQDVEAAARAALFSKRQLKLVCSSRDDGELDLGFRRRCAPPDRLHDKFEDIIVRGITLFGGMPIRDFILRGHFDAGSVIGREIGVPRLACRAGAADVERLEIVRYKANLDFATTAELNHGCDNQVRFRYMICARPWGCRLQEPGLYKTVRRR